MTVNDRLKSGKSMKKILLAVVPILAIWAYAVSQSIGEVGSMISVLGESSTRTDPLIQAEAGPQAAEPAEIRSARPVARPMPQPAVSAAPATRSEQDIPGFSYLPQGAPAYVQPGMRSGEPVELETIDDPRMRQLTLPALDD